MMSPTASSVASVTTGSLVSGDGVAGECDADGAVEAVWVTAGLEGDWLDRDGCVREEASAQDVRTIANRPKPISEAYLPPADGILLFVINPIVNSRFPIFHRCRKAASCRCS